MAPKEKGQLVQLITVCPADVSISALFVGVI